ncbi:hypothetical protein [Paenibacillus sp. MMS20-IR301]|uniref:hypothetical protein n=1 Tax=Paenibacillus sp. MMS20-IR301 TaxID=2895946 RepID=UPI0028F07397|nr:hypothetical protein [Paenibacillus sp. MMS20-IR301]WNS44447.1 hypothetical protein LOS79_04020 [Paenibacillus sp. MMS20-IR301]
MFNNYYSGGAAGKMGPVIFLLACYAAVLLYLFHHARDIFALAWNQERSNLSRRLVMLSGLFILLLLMDFLVLNTNWEHAGRSFILPVNIFLGAVVLTIVLGIFALRYVFAGIITFLYIFDLVQYRQFLTAITGDSSRDGGIGYGLLFNIFINLIGFAVAVAIDHVIHLVQKAKV